ncbi:MAG TPA: hypothetical protein VK703_16560 [Candidatus Acidoferrales bacterium]|jgi:ElaB/YqjD/DUF883 family membrane-anchored ribosome-binding protein|nr:hypothetical protein [Candidatus Acidoferrales bacterium]
MDANNRESAADVSNPSSGSSAAAARMKQTIADKTSDAKEAIDELGRKAVGSLEQSRESTAKALHKTATSLESGADQFSDFGHMAAEKLHATADYVRETDIQSIGQDLQGVIKRYPVQSLAAAAIFGFLIARGLRR